MKIQVILRSALFVALTAAAGVVSANPSIPLPSCQGPVEFDGRYYELVAQNGISWNTAKAAAKNKVFNGITGHLATITSEREDVFVERLRKCARARTSNRLLREEVWVGGSQQNCTPQPRCGWQWENDEGPISVPPGPFELPSYSNWLANEPNNLGGNERHLGIGLRGEFGWNDEGNLGNIGGYIVEYDTSSNISAIECIGPFGCETTLGQTLRFPAGVNPDGKIGVRTYEFTDPRLDPNDPRECGEDSLTLFEERLGEELIIPPYLCGSPKFLVVEVTTEDIQIVQGTVFVENEPIVTLPGNWYECDGLASPPPTPPAPLLAGDPQGRDVVTWQARDPENMRESGPLAASIDPSFVGALGEFTFECGSSRGLTRTASYFVIGMHINFGQDFSPFVASQFVALTRYKLQLLQESVEESGPWLSNGDFVLLRTHLNNAIRFHDRGRYSSALKSIGTFLKMVDKAVYQPNPEDFNYNGEHLSRAKNIAFMYQEKVIPFVQ